MQRKIKRVVQGMPAVDGAGVHLVRVLGYNDVEEFDPFLMLDSFDSQDPRDYVAGFPMHPHRGIETITYLIEGRIEHEDSLGNKGAILSGQSQWMTAGRGILHQEMPKPSPRMLGFQLWLNLPRIEKMTEPAYYEITQEMIPRVEAEGAVIRVIAGAYGAQEGAKPRHLKATLYDVEVLPGREITLPTSPEETVFVFLILGGAVIGGRQIREKSAVLFDYGEEITVRAGELEAARFIFYSAKPIHEPVAWGGPIVMNTEEELELAFRQLRAGTFLNQASGSTSH